MRIHNTVIHDPDNITENECVKVDEYIVAI